MTNAITVQREQSRSEAERRASLYLAMANEYRLMRELIEQHALAAAPSVAAIRRSIARDLCRRLHDAEISARTAQEQATERQNTLTQALAASATYRAGDARPAPNQAHLAQPTPVTPEPAWLSDDDEHQELEALLGKLPR